MFRQENCLQLTQKRNQRKALAADLAKLNIEVGGTKTKQREKMRVRKSWLMIVVMKQ